MVQRGLFSRVRSGIRGLIRDFARIGLHFNALQHSFSKTSHSHSVYHLGSSPSTLRHLYCHKQVSFSGFDPLPVLLNELSRMTFKRGHSLCVMFMPGFNV